MKLSLLLPVLLLSVACKGEDSSKVEAAKPSASAAAPAPEAAKSVKDLPKEALALNESGNEIPATIEVPKGSTIFADTPTSLRIELGQGDAFGVQVAAGNEFNLDLADSAKSLAENKYGSTNEILEKTDTLLRYTMTTDGHTSHKFTLITELPSGKWICTQGNNGGWTEEEAAAQLQACKTLAAK